MRKYFDGRKIKGNIKKKKRNKMKDEIKQEKI